MRYWGMGVGWGASRLPPAPWLAAHYPGTPAHAQLSRPTPAPAQAFGFVSAPHNWVSRKDEADKIIVVEKGEQNILACSFSEGGGHAGILWVKCAAFGDL